MRSLLDSAYTGLYIAFHYVAWYGYLAYQHTAGLVWNLVAAQLDKRRYAAMVAAAVEIFEVSPATTGFDAEQSRQVVRILKQREDSKQQATQVWIAFQMNPNQFIEQHAEIQLVLESGPSSFTVEVDQDPTRREASLRKVAEILENNVDSATQGYDRAEKVAGYFDPDLIERLDFAYLWLDVLPAMHGRNRLKLIK